MYTMMHNDDKNKTELEMMEDLISQEQELSLSSEY